MPSIHKQYLFQSASMQPIFILKVAFRNQKMDLKTLNISLDYFSNATMSPFVIKILESLHILCTKAYKFVTACMAEKMRREQLRAKEMSNH